LISEEEEIFVVVVVFDGEKNVLLLLMCVKTNNSNIQNKSYMFFYLYLIALKFSPLNSSWQSLNLSRTRKTAAASAPSR
jgi:hypothetical protein